MRKPGGHSPAPLPKGELGIGPAPGLSHVSTADLLSGVKGKERSQPEPESGLDVPSITGKELGEYQSLQDLRIRARKYAKQHFLGKTILVESDQSEVIIPSAGINKATSGKRTEVELLSTVALPDMLRTGNRIAEEADRRGDPNIRRVFTYESTLLVGGKRVQVGIIVKENREGKRFYDRYELNKPAVMPEGMSPASPLPDSGTAGLTVFSLR